LFIGSNLAIDNPEVTRFGAFTATDLSSNGTVTSEPSSWLMLGSGLLGLMGFAYHRSKAFSTVSSW